VDQAARVLYVATGERHIREAAGSLRSLWRHHPSMAVTMYVDEPSRPHTASWGIPEPSDGHLLEMLDHPGPTYSWADKPLALSERVRDEERTLFLDTDTRVCGDLAEVFDLLDAFDLAAAHAPIRIGPGQPAALSARAPASFPELNTGVIAYRGTTAVRGLLDRWRSLHEEWSASNRANLGDQATFRVALYGSDVRFAVLPPEFNCRFTFPTYVQGPVRILHGRAPDPEAVERELNATTGPRAYVPGLGVLRNAD
jgi:hypothetical protein